MEIVLEVFIVVVSNPLFLECNEAEFFVVEGKTNVVMLVVEENVEVVGELNIADFLLTTKPQVTLSEVIIFIVVNMFTGPPFKVQLLELPSNL